MILIMAWRNIWRSKGRSIVIMLSVAIGLFAGLAALALYKGMLRSRVRTVIDAEVGHIQIHHPRFKDDYAPALLLPDEQRILSVLQAIPEVRQTAQRSVTQGMLVTASSSAGVQINGVVPEQEYIVSGLGKKIIEGRPFDTMKTNQIIIGKKLARKMKLKPGAKLVLTFSDTSGSVVSAAFRVCAIYQSGNAPLDELNVYVLRSSLNELLLVNGASHELSILLRDDDVLSEVQENLKKHFPNLSVQSWKEISPETDLMVRTVDTYSYIIMLIILIALAFGILNTMLMSVLERTREIGIMVALGTSRMRVFLMVLLETIFLTLAGTPLGLLAALLLTDYYQKHALNLSRMGKDMMESFGFSTMVYPVFPWEKLAGVMLMVLGTALLACLPPASKALRLRPVDALRR
jgi:ABC-type lipoprotein release transport system permease subunit